MAAPEPPQIASRDGADAKSFIYQHESGNRPDAVNKQSGACGIGQALPCSKMTCSLRDYACQDDFFTKYMLAGYGSWSAAKAFWLCIGICNNKFATITKTTTWW